MSSLEGVRKTVSGFGNAPTGPDRQAAGPSGAALSVWAIAGLVALAHAGKLAFVPADSDQEWFFTRIYGLTPAFVPDNPTSLLSHMLVHDSFLHLGLNLLIFIVAGLRLGPALGRAGGVKLAALTVWSGLCGAAALVLSDPDSLIAMIGFSGAASGLAAAYLVRALFQSGAPWDRVMARRAAIVLAGLAVGLGLEMAWRPDGDLIAWEAHLGGMVGGVGGYLALSARLRPV